MVYVCPSTGDVGKSIVRVFDVRATANMTPATPGPMGDVGVALVTIA